MATIMSLPSNQEFPLKRYVGIHILATSALAVCLLGAACRLNAQTATNTVVQNQVSVRSSNPHIDVTTYGVRAVSHGAAPAIVDVKASCTSGSAQITLNHASSFRIGDGVDVFGCGPPHTMATPPAPIVTNVIAAAPTGTGYSVASPAGSICRYYKIVARDVGQGLTAASPEASTCTGQPLGGRPIKISTCSRNSVTQEATCNGTNSLAAGAMVQIVETSDDANFGGWETISSATTSTFSWRDGRNTNNGAATSATGGTGYMWNANKLVLPAPGTGVFQYGIYAGSSSGNETLCDVYTHVDLSGDSSNLVWEDFGPAMSCNPNLPSFWPPAPPNAPTSDSLVTTISSAAGTTALTLATAARTTNPSQTILFDNTPTLQAAMAVSNATGLPLYLPPPPNPTQAYVTNSYCVLKGNISIAGLVWLNDTLQFSGKLDGDLTPNSVAGLCPQFCIGAHNTIYDGQAKPGIIFKGGNISGLTFAQATANAYNSVLAYGAGIPSWTIDNVSFIGGGNDDLMGIPFIQLAQFSAGGSAGTQFHNVLFSTGPGQKNGATATPLFISKNYGEVSMDGIMMNRRGLFFQPNQAGLTLDFNMKYEEQGNIMPVISTYSGGTSYIILHGMIEDTGSSPVYSSFGNVRNFLTITGSTSAHPTIVSGTALASIVALDPSLSPMQIGQNVGLVVSSSPAVQDGFYQTYEGGSSSVGATVQDQHFALGRGMSLFTSENRPAAPTCSNGAAGTVPAAGTYGIYYAAQYANGGLGKPSLVGRCKADGVHQLDVTIPKAVPGAKGYLFAADDNNKISTSPFTQGLTFSWNGKYLSGGALPAAPGGGPSGMRDGTMWTNHLVISTGPDAYAGTATLSHGTATVNTTAVLSGSHIILTLQNCSNCGTLSVGFIVNATSFVINSANISDGSTVYWEIR
jgi:hypothetical protein